MALSYVIRDRLLHRWINTAATYTRQGSRTVAYLSAEFLMGPHLGNNLVNMGITSTTRDAMKELGLNLEEMLGQEEEPGLGNGGLGGSLPVTLIRWRRWRCPRSVTEYVMNTAFFTRSFVTANRLN